ncbi:MAG: PAS domain-containing protein [Verrucomicrobia bacterium]|nr:PAS domain-containing protein [Verrucomicrobiota bacterium]
MKHLSASGRVALGAGLSCLLMGGFVLAGWWLDVPSFKSLLTPAGYMKANSALGFILAGAALALNVTPAVRRWDWFVAAVLSALVTLIGGLTLAEYLLGTNLGIDELLATDFGGDEIAPPGRMSVNGAVGFVLAGHALTLLNGQPRKRRRPMAVGLLACVLLGLALFSLSGLAFDLPTTYRWEGASPMALRSSLGFMALAVGLMALVHEWSQREGLALVRWVPLAVGTSALTITLLLWQALRVQEERQIDRVGSQQASEIRQLIHAEAQARVLALTRFARRWEARSGRNPTDWSFDARLYLSHYPDMKALGWVDERLVTRSIMPRGSLAFLDTNSAPNLRRDELVRTARDRQDVFVSPTMDSGGERAFLMFAPMARGTNFSGLVVGLFSVKGLVESALGPVTRGHWFKLLEGDREIFRSSASPDELGRSRQLAVMVQDVPWTLRAWPTVETVDELRTPLATVALGGGATLAGLLGIATYLTQTSRARERELRASNRALEAEVAERKQAQELLRESQQRLQAILDNSFAVIYLKDSQGRYLLVNRRFETLFHVERDTMLGKTDLDVFPKLMAEAFRANDERALQSRAALTIEEIAPQDDGLHTYISVKFPLRDGAGEPYGVCGISTDITERKRAESQLRTSHEALEFANHRLRGIIEGTHDRIAALDTRYCFLTFNSAYRDAFRRDFGRDISIGMRLSDPLSHVPDEQEEQLIGWARALRGEVFTVTRAMKSGEEVRHFEISFSPIRDEHGELLGAAQHIRDLTERQRAEDERARLLAEVASRNGLLEAANKELEAFSYSVSHDLRAPLRHIDGFAGLVQRTALAKLDTKEQRYLSLIIESAKRMGRLIDDLLDFSRMGRAEMRRDTVDMAALVQTVLRDLEPDTQGRAIEWHCGPLPPVPGDASLLRQVWSNLIANAVKYSRPRAIAVIEIGCEKDKPGETIFFVRDNGVGFEMKYASHLFGVFQRLHRPEDFEGTGIGLANVRRIIARHGGRTWAEGQPDAGATVWFTLPKLAAVGNDLKPPGAGASDAHPAN